MSYISGIKTNKIFNLIYLTKNKLFVKNFLTFLAAQERYPRFSDALPFFEFLDPFLCSGMS
jgi:hypothetical protein